MSHPDYTHVFRSKLPEHRHLYGQPIKIITSYGVERLVQFQDGTKIVVGAGCAVRRKVS
jgi:hypothetical protein